MSEEDKFVAGKTLANQNALLELFGSEGAGDEKDSNHSYSASKNILSIHAVHN